MQTSDLILAIVGSQPERVVRGKKRLQKLAYLLKEAGLECEAEFILYDYGPYSFDVAQSASILALTGQVEELEEPFGESRTFVTVYKLTEGVSPPKLDQNYANLLNQLDEFSTIELEIAATIRLFERQSASRGDAIARTRAMKPSKTTSRVVERANLVLSRIDNVH